MSFTRSSSRVGPLISRISAPMLWARCWAVPCGRGTHCQLREGADSLLLGGASPSLRMLPNEATAPTEVATRPEEIEALVASPSRDAARPLVAFLRQEKLNVTVMSDADSTFEEALIHRPNLVVIDAALDPEGGLELCRRLKSNGRTHFLPTIIHAGGHGSGRGDRWATPAARVAALQAGADALFSASDDIEEARARLWALLRSEALHRRQERRQKLQGFALKDRGRWLEGFVHDLQNAVGALQANFEFLGQTALARSAETSEDVSDCVRETRNLLQQLGRGLRTVQDFERFESGLVRPRHAVVALDELLAEVKEDVNWQLGPEGQARLHVQRGPESLTVLGDRDLLRQALSALATHLLRQPRTSELRAHLASGRAGPTIVLASDAPAFPESDGERMFEPYARVSRRTGLAQGIALAHARAVLELHGGSVRAEEGPSGGAAFSVQLKSRDPSPNLLLGR